VETLWSMSTTIRNPNRIKDVLSTIKKIEGEEWNDETQKKLQALLIKNRYYTPTAKNLSNEQIELLENAEANMTYEQAIKIFNDKNYESPPMRGRTSFDPIEKLGLVNVINSRVCISNFGNKFINGEIDLGEVILSSFLKLQYPNPVAQGFGQWNTKPFINAIRLIKKVNVLCAEKGMKEKGVSTDEFGIFVLSLKSHKDVDETAQKLIEYRVKKESITDERLKKKYIDEFTAAYLIDFKDPINNTKEYTDNMIRYFRLTKYIYIRGNGSYVDLEPRRMIEINSLLESDNGKCKNYTKDEWIEYMGNYEAYELPWEKEDKLREIATKIIEEVHIIEADLKRPITNFNIGIDKESLKETIKIAREKRTKLQNLKIKNDYAEVNKISEAIYALQNIRALDRKASIELEKWSKVALNIINDAILIKPNSPIGDDNEPTFTAPSGVPDIECYYETFAAICEVTMLTGRDQWYNEGQPVQRHLRDFEEKNNNKPNYCLFIAPRLHKDTINTFWNAVKYEYEGEKQRIVPMTITQIILILEAIKNIKEKGKTVNKEQMRALYNSCIEISRVPNSTEWQSHISQELEKWKLAITA